MIMPELSVMETKFPDLARCLECEIGKKVMEKQKQKSTKAKTKNQNPQPKKWPALANVADDYTQRIEALSDAMCKAVEDTGLPVEEVIFLGLEVGFEFYLEKVNGVSKV